ncbi:Protein LOC81691 [Strongyloides ratti]|uniref:Protein LOC81691 n=1 Tax=Strongyloides ratti TaxID=34506 RepID=A0A090KXL2_STRRB|nr:Protein LOC81691 [Strongyloides ratti]CEF62215.1 Protein LOC81691 [Strongyloides ratti]
MEQVHYPNSWQFRRSVKRVYWNSSMASSVPETKNQKTIEREGKKRQRRWMKIEAKLYATISHYKASNVDLYVNEFQDAVNKIIDEKKHENVCSIIKLMEQKFGPIPKPKPFKEEIVETTICEAKKINSRISLPPFCVSNFNLAQIFLSRCIVDYLKPRWLRTSSRKMNSQHLIMKIKLSEDQYDNTPTLLPNIHSFFQTSMYKIRQESMDEIDFWKPFYKVNKYNINDTHSDFPKYPDEILSLTGNDLKPYLLLNDTQMLQLSYPLPYHVNRSHFIQTRKFYDKITSESPYFTIDCEMVNTDQGLGKLARFSLLDQNGSILMDTLVKPKGVVTDYLTKHSGIYPGMLNDIDVTIEDVQEYLCKVLPPDAILVGHTLNCDLNALGICHPYISDISALYNYGRRIVNRISLKNLVGSYLNVSCQDGGVHCSVEDSIVTMNLYKQKLKYGLGYGNYHYSTKEQTINFKKRNEDSESSSEGSVDIPIKREKVDDENTYDGSDDENEEKEFIPIKKEITCNRCKRIVTVPCLIPDCPCFENTQNNCIKCFNETHEPPENKDENPIEWKRPFQGDKLISSSDTVCLSEYLDGKSNIKHGHHVLFAGRGFSKWIDKTKHINVIDRGNYNNDGDFLMEIGTTIWQYSSMAISLDLENEKEKEASDLVNAAIKSIINGLSINGLFVCVLETTSKKCLYLKSKIRKNFNK